MSQRTQLYDKVNSHIHQLMMERQVILYPKIDPETNQAPVITDEDLQKVPLIEKAIDEGRRFFLPINR